MSDPKETPNSPEELNTESASTGSSTEEKPSSNRRQFVTGVATVLGGGLLLHTTNKASTTGNDAAEVRSRILSRIQEDLKKSQNELVFGYDKPDTSTPYGRYVKADPPAGSAPMEQFNNN
jgi:hypothetical protein